MPQQPFVIIIKKVRAPGNNTILKPKLYKAGHVFSHEVNENFTTLIKHLTRELISKLLNIFLIILVDSLTETGATGPARLLANFN